MNKLNSNTQARNNFIPDDIIDQVKNLDIIEAIDPYLKITKNGSGYEAICPFHDDHDPSLKINPARGIYKCFVCNEYGTDAINIVMKVKGVQFPEAVRMIAGDHQIEIPKLELSDEDEANYKKREAIYNINQWAGGWYSDQFKLSQYTTPWKYVKSRWNDESIKTFDVGYAPDGWRNLLTAAKKEGYKEELLLDAGLIMKKEKDGKEHTYDIFRDRIIFPIKDRRGIVGFTGRCLPDKTEEPKYKNTGETLVYHKSKVLYNLALASRIIKDQGNVYLVEGQADVIRLHQIGICNCVAISGTSLSQGHIEELKKITPCITLIGDNDQAGQASVNRSAKLIIKNGLYCKIIQLPQSEEKLDPDSLFTDKARFDLYDGKPNKKDYIYYLAEKEKDSHQEPDQKARLISEITSMVLSLPDETHDIYFTELGIIIPPKTSWKGKNIKPSTAKNEHKNLKEENEEHETKANNEQIKHDHDFYFIEKDREGQFKDIKIDRVKFIEKLKESGFIRFDAGIDSYRFLKAQNNTVTEVSTTLITDHFITFIENIEGYQHKWEGGSKFIDSTILKRKMFNGIDTFFSSTLLKRLNPEKPVSIKKDSRYEKFLFYQNGFVSVTKDGYSFHNYSELDSYIWSNQILKRDFCDNPSIYDKPAVFQRFIWNICNKDEDRFKSMQSIIGYALHNFMECKLFAVILTDSKISQDGEPNGRTGKTLWGKGLGQMLNTDERGSVFMELNGKDFSPKNKFKYEDANLDTQLIHINDIYNNYNIENSFNDITEGIKIDKKNEKPIVIRPKFIFSTNKTIIIEGESAKDRVIQFEFSEHYDSEFNPSKEFGIVNEDGTYVPHWFFIDWDSDEWARFDYFMISCIIHYFQHGLIKPVEINLSKRTLLDHTCQEFISFMDDAMSENGISTEVQENLLDIHVDFNIKRSELFSKRQAFEIFIKLNPDFNNQRFRQRDFTRWLRMYAKYKNVTNVESRSNGKDYFLYEW